jgi:hypothetical protein
MPVQWVTREMIVRLAHPYSLVRLALHDGARERMAARLLVSSFVLLVSGLALLLFGEWR